jgi:oligo-1,6-glucosidase/alpha-glucosidase
LPWWQTTTIYQIYPRSFMDSNGDGIGDLPGILNRLDYLQDLGCETLWLSPFVCSPLADWGYDISDYTQVAPEYGTLADAEALIQAVHARGMRIIFDLVMNHTSDQHPWFQEARRSRDNSKRDWYIWKPGRGKRPPNNWNAIPGGSGWHYDPATGEWYFANFLPFQPDLNYRNPAVKAAMFDVARFWLEKGMDGFRLDIFHSIYKDAAFRDNPFALTLLPTHSAGLFQEWKYSLNQPESFALARELRAFVEVQRPGGLLLGEVFGAPETVRQYLGANQDGLNLIFLWDLQKPKAQAGFLRRVIRSYEAGYPAPYQPVYVFGNHDQKRLLSKLGGDLRLAKLMALFQLTVRGVPVIYYGEELGLPESRNPVQPPLDPVGRRFSWAPDWLFDLLGVYTNRDGCRTPMQWDAGPQAGFCPPQARPWLPVHPGYPQINAAAALADPDSLLNLYRALLRLRRAAPALQAGALTLLEGPAYPADVLLYTREYAGAQVLAALNFSPQARRFENPTACREVLFKLGVGQVDPAGPTLPPYTGLVLGSAPIGKLG